MIRTTNHKIIGRKHNIQTKVHHMESVYALLCRSIYILLYYSLHFILPKRMHLSKQATKVGWVNHRLLLCYVFCLSE